MTRMLVLCVAVLGAVLFLFWIAQRRLIYLPFDDVPSPAEVGLPRAATITLDTEDGLTLHGWFVSASAPASRDTVVVFNGNAGNRAFRSDLASRLSEQGFAVLLFDYRGYGGNPGSPSEEGIALDARAARRYLDARRDVDPRRIVYFGESLGAAVAVRLALEHRPRALILRSPFTSLVDMGRHHYPFLPVSWLLSDRYPSSERISRIGCPLLVITAAHDSIVPSDQSRRLFEAAPEPKRLLTIENADHNDEALVAGPRVITAVSDFLRDLG
jgi:fermentation-respiration switch protein FrsA (DUF1100 family)